MDEKTYEKKGLTEIHDEDTLIAGMWYGLNYGSIITAFALYKTVEGLGKKPILLNKPKDMWTSHYEDPDNIAGRFIYKNCRVASQDISSEELEKCDTFLTGSDVVWNYDICGDYVTENFTGRFLKGDITRISCASSFGKIEGDHMGAEQMLAMKKALDGYKGVSVRNGYDVGVCQNKFGITPEIILDPVFLCDTEEYEKVIRTAHFDVGRGPYIFTYIENGNARIKKYIETGMKIRNQEARNYIDINRFEESEKELGLKSTFNVMADDWLCSIWNCDFVVTDSYYGACFAILFHKPFAVITPSDFKTENDMRELLSMFELEDRIVPCNPYSDMKEYEYLFRKNINWYRADQKLKSLREESLLWLHDNIIEREKMS